MFIRRTKTHLWVQTKALLAFILAVSLTVALISFPLWVSATPLNPQQIVHKTLTVYGVDTVYREAGLTDAPTIVLLHGFPISSHMFRNLIPALADRSRPVGAALAANALGL